MYFTIITFILVMLIFLAIKTVMDLNQKGLSTVWIFTIGIYVILTYVAIPISRVGYTQKSQAELIRYEYSKINEVLYIEIKPKRIYALTNYGDIKSILDTTYSKVILYKDYNYYRKEISSRIEIIK